MKSQQVHNVLGDNNRLVSHILKLDTITPGSDLLTAKFVALKRVNREPILTVE